jgi:DNA-binding transcriptional LysR family regulator
LNGKDVAKAAAVMSRRLQSRNGKALLPILSFARPHLTVVQDNTKRDFVTSKITMRIIKPAQLDPRLLQTFVQVVEAGNFAKAAAALKMTQPAVSGHVRRFERLLNAKLFERMSGQRNVRLTAFGERLLPYAHEILRLNHSVISKLVHPEVVGTVRLGATEDHAAYLLPPIIGAFHREHPLVEVVIETGMTMEMREHVGSRYDMVLAAQPVGTGRGQVLRRERLHWAGSSDHQAHLEDPLALAVYPDGCVYRRWVERALSDHGRSWRIAVTSASRSAIEATVLQGLAVSALPGFSFRKPLVKLGNSDGLPELPNLELALYRNPNTGQAQRVLAKAIIDAIGG